MSYAVLQRVLHGSDKCLAFVLRTQDERRAAVVRVFSSRLESLRRETGLARLTVAAESDVWLFHFFAQSRDGTGKPMMPLSPLVRRRKTLQDTAGWRLKSLPDSIRRGNRLGLPGWPGGLAILESRHPSEDDPFIPQRPSTGTEPGHRPYGTSGECQISPSPR